MLQQFKDDIQFQEKTTLVAEYLNHLQMNIQSYLNESDVKDLEKQI